MRSPRLNAHLVQHPNMMSLADEHYWQSIEDVAVTYDDGEQARQDGGDDAMSLWLLAETCMSRSSLAWAKANITATTTPATLTTQWPLPISETMQCSKKFKTTNRRT